MYKEAIVQQLKSSLDFFQRSTRVLAEEHSGFRPKEDMFSVVEQVTHTAQTVDWFINGAFRPEGFDMDFAKGMREMKAVTSLAVARAWLERAYANAIAVAESKSQEEWDALFPPNPIMGEAPKWSIISGLADHTAHHRGALTVYSRLLGLVPPMPYADM
jgi:uncharacterized damage-inducible protein DinB